MVSDPGCPYLFPILYDPEKKTEREYSSALRVYNKRLDSLSSLLELDEPLTSYVARHTWASLARQCGTSDTVISEAMGHSHVGGDNYLPSLVGYRYGCHGQSTGDNLAVQKAYPLMGSHENWIFEDF